MDFGNAEHGESPPQITQHMPLPPIALPLSFEAVPAQSIHVDSHAGLWKCEIATCQWCAVFSAYNMPLNHRLNIGAAAQRVIQCFLSLTADRSALLGGHVRTREYIYTRHVLVANEFLQERIGTPFAWLANTMPYLPARSICPLPA